MQEYRAPFFLLNGHIETIYPVLFRKTPLISFYSERITTPDDDFLELDWVKQDKDKLVIISHGLEGNSRRPYMLGMATAFAKKGYDVLLWNYRSCGSEMNKALRLYHSGATDDLQTVIHHAIANGYTRISLAGFSLGGNLTLKYIGENAGNIPPELKNAVVFSVPCDLSAAAIQLNRWFNRIYSNRFLYSLKLKVIEKSKKFEVLQEKLHLLKTIKSLQAFDDAFTAPMHGFTDAEDYYRKSGSIRFLSHIRIPVLIVNSTNDPFLPEACYPLNEARQNSCITLEMPSKGGHCGFGGKGGIYWSETRATDFCDSVFGS